MITFKNIDGNKFLAVGTIQRKSALNGEKSLTGTLYDGKDVLNKIDKGWSLEFDGEPYVVTYFERNDNDNRVSFDAIHKFFWDMAKKVLYSSTEISGSHTIKWYLDQIFANTGYTYALNFSPAAIEKDNWGNKTRLSLFNDLITSIAGEFEINGTLISIFQNIGTDLSTIVRYGFNLSDMTIENDAASFVTYGEGFGAYADQQNQTGDRVHVTYTSPLAGVYGILQAEPIDDQRYTSQANLQAAVKAQVDASFSVSVQLSLYDLTAAGYPYKMANVGDWLTAVDENLDFKQRIRIISIDDEFSDDGTRISYTVTAGDTGLTKKYQDANASMASQIANAVASASQASTDANNALISANGKNTSYYLNGVDDLPATANEGDLAWVKSGDGTVMYIYTKKADGSYYWEKRIDPEMGDQIAAGVTDAVSQANAHTDEVKQGLSTDITTAKSQASSQANEAEENAKSAATSQFTQAQSALSAAKSDLTNSIASEASARNQAVSAANSQAQTYANQAKADAMSAASSADGVIRTAISSSANSLSATITQNKSSADSGISTAQTTAKAAVDGLAFKVSKTDYDQKTGELSSHINDVKDTADKSAQTIADIQEADGRRDSRISEVEKTAGEIKSTVSDISTAQGKQSGYISTLQQRADGFDATVTKVDNLSVGGRNLLLGTSNSTTLTTGSGGWGAGGIGNVSSTYGQNNQLVISFIIDLVNTTSIPKFRFNFTNDWGWDNETKPGCSLSSLDPVWIIKKISDTKYYMAAPFLVDFSTNGIPGHIEAIIEPNKVNASFILSQVKVESGNTATDWTPAPEDVQSDIAQVKITADSISNFVRDSNGNISSDFQTALSKSNVIVDGNNKMISLINQKSDEIVAQISSVNLFPNSEFESDYGYESLSGDVKLSLDHKWTVGSNRNGVVEIKTTASSYQGYVADKIAVFGGSTISFSTLLHYENGGLSNGQAGVDMRFYDRDGNVIGKQFKYLPQQSDYWTTLLMENIYVPDTSVSLSITLIINDAGVGQYAVFAQPMLVNSSTIKKYAPNTDITTTLMLLKDKWAIGLADNIGNITSGIIGDSGSMSLISKNIVLDGDTTVTGDFYAKGGNFTNLNASNITVGTLNGNQVNITNLNASNIVSGAISGANLNINLNTGSVVFQKGRINSSDYTTDINIDQGYISTANRDTRALLTQGKLQLIDPTLFSPQTNPYLEISNNSDVFNGMSALIKARDSLTVSINGYDDRGISIPPSTETFVGLSIGKSNSKLMPTKIGGAEQGVIISGGARYSVLAGTDSPYIYVGSDSSGVYPNGDRIYLNGSYVHSPSTYFRTASGSANVVVAADGALIRSSSARKYKLDIKNDISIADSLKLIEVPLSTWVDKHEHEENGSNERYFGMIAEDLRDAGLEYLVQYGEDNEVEGINYDRVALLLIPLVKKLKERIEELESEGK